MGFEELSAVGGGLGVDPVAVAVDGDVVVVPAQRDEVVGVVVAAVLSFSDVVGLEAVGAVAPFDRALVLVAPLHVAADVAGDGFSQIRVGDGVESVGDDDPDLAGAEDLGQSVGSDPGSGGDGGSRLLRNDSAARLASMKTSATVTARSVPDPSELPVRVSMQMEVKASARRCPCPWWGRTGSSPSRAVRAFSMMRPSIPGRCSPQFEDRFVQAGLDHQIPVLEHILSRRPG